MCGSMVDIQSPTTEIISHLNYLMVLHCLAKQETQKLRIFT